MTKLQAINEDQPKNLLQSEMYLKAQSVDLKWHSDSRNTTFDEQLVVFREKCPFHMLTKSRLGKCGIKIWVAVYAKRCYAYETQVYTGLSDRAREKQSLRDVKYNVCHMYGARRGDTTVNFCTSLEGVNFLFTKNMTWVVTLTKKKLEISTLFLIGKQRQVNSFTEIFGFGNELKIVPYIPARNKGCHSPFIKSS
jgi:hypothetical protein